MSSPIQQSWLPIYCLNAYAQAQNYAEYLRFETENGVFCFALSADTAISLPKSPIGGCAFSGEEEAFHQELKSVENELQSKGIKRIVITSNPDFYPTHLHNRWMQQAGYQSTDTEISHYIEINSDFYSNLHHMQQRHLKKNLTLQISRDSRDSLSEIHTFIAECRRQQNLEINISEGQLVNLIATFPNGYDLFTARLNGKLISAVICVRATEKIIYYYLPATDEIYKSFSPMVHLLAYLHDFYFRLGFEKIDLGISSKNGLPQESLIQFKERMGGIESCRITWEKTLQ